jgi:hypothetical protein
VDYGLTALLLRAAKASGVRPRFIYLSAAGAREGPAPTWRSARASNASWPPAASPGHAARPAFISGPDREEKRAGEHLMSGLLDGVLKVAGRRARDRWASMDAPTLARGLVRLVTDPTPDRVVAADELRRDS